MKNDTNNNSIELANVNGLKKSMLIPERTRSLLWVTDEAFQDVFVEVLNPMTGEITIDRGQHAEASLIWTQLPVEPNQAPLPTEPLYYPTYTGLTPQQRFQYLDWLRDITQPTFKSYVFLYFYGLERHLAIGNFDDAVNEIKLLIEHHDLGFYPYSSLALASVIRGKNLLERVPELEVNLPDPAWLRAYNKQSLSPDIVLKYASAAGFGKLRYVKQQPDLFREQLQRAIDQLEKTTGGPFFAYFTPEIEGYTKFFNPSLSEVTEGLEIPALRHNKQFEETIYSLLDTANTQVRLILNPDAAVLQSNAPVMNSERKAELQAELNAVLDRLATKYTPTPNKHEDKTDEMSDVQFQKSLEQLGRIDAVASVNPDEAIAIAAELISSGYRAPAVYLSMAAAYRRKGDHRAAFNLLMQARVDYGYNFNDQLSSLLKHFKADLVASTTVFAEADQLHETISQLVGQTEASPWSGQDKTVELSQRAREKLRKEITQIWRLTKTEPDKALKEALALFDDGYRNEYICRCIAAAYRQNKEYQKELNFLIQVKRDFSFYDFDSRLRQTLKLLQKSKDQSQA